MKRKVGYWGEKGELRVFSEGTNGILRKKSGVWVICEEKWGFGEKKGCLGQFVRGKGGILGK